MLLLFLSAFLFPVYDDLFLLCLPLDIKASLCISTSSDSGARFHVIYCMFSLLSSSLLNFETRECGFVNWGLEKQHVPLQAA